ncbi:tyrosine-protein phosphatase [Microbacterium sp. SORGH_AS_0888]|uniref:tyrosine-protein phosphatase n=1 Tax=Microbacterium sp. SORGH_AS_0888 TaxID=3041791 RepID=UPI00278A0969|nr:tyrosine-protein phosphatase [Microbacterium sp. SORGH_AS_0888]MDQ1130695.1 protein-tyrosine phosphatase [Microbacterium sp. SORGH_AS_0888]
MTSQSDTDARHGNVTPPPEVRNFRDLGGIENREGRTLRFGRIFRSGHFGATTREYRTSLNTRGVRRIDLRGADEIALEDAELPDAAEALRGPSYVAEDDAVWSALRSGRLDKLAPTFTATRAAEVMMRLYGSTIASHVPLYRDCFAELLADEHPVVIHCSAGKDRTGWAVAILLTVLDVPEERIIADYLESSHPDRQYVIRDESGAPVPTDDETRLVLAPLLEARPEYLAHAWDAVTRSWGSRTAYIEDGLGITADRRAAFQAQLLQ